MISQDSTNHNQDTFFMDFLTHETLFDSSASTPEQALKRESVFEGHSLQVSDSQMPVIVNKPEFQPPSWIFFIFIIQFILIGIVITVFRYSFRLQLSSAFSQNNLEQLIREGNPIKQTYSVLLLLVYGLSMSIFAYISLKLYGPGIEINDQRLFIYLFAAILGVPLIKIILFSIIGYASGDKNVNSFYISNLIIFDILIGLIILPVVFIFTYRHMPGVLYFISALSILLFIIRGIRGIQLVFKRSSFIGLYIILYLCTLEIAPIFWMIITIQRMIGNMV